MQHLPCAGLKDGEASQAVAGGVNIMLSPTTTVKICRLQVTPAAAECCRLKLVPPLKP